MTNQPLVSIIIPTYNRSDLIGETLDSIIAQTYQNWECIVVDDGSTDNTEEVLSFYTQRDNRISYHQRPKKYKPGGNGARNYGFDISKGEYINWFDSDDVMMNDKVERQIESLLTSGLDFTVCQLAIFEKSAENIIGLRSQSIYSEDNFYDYLVQKNAWLTNSVIFNKKILLRHNFRFNEKLRAAQEWEFLSKILSSINQYAIINKVLVKNRKHSDSISYNKTKAKERMINYIIARKFVYTYIGKRRNLIQEKEYLLKYIKKNTEDLIKNKDFISLNKVIFFSGINFKTLISFFSIYFFICTDKLKSKIKYV
ncbi:glycosyltransferase family 2 protein [Empedobacter brevis]|uniref:glycosyltransferase family 2 protein n=1 Tax=Empedobacter brevis TaxID=247 RepID=UPI00131F87E8|nr:glycosyltransferase family 2 protein [Empedobacter brevis]QHC83417.1 hypothetical protein AS589_00680 [Empedobacter brevis]